MKFEQKSPPRTFAVGNKGEIKIQDCGSISLDADEQITFVTESGKEYDVTRKSWGYYATPSINGRLERFGYLTALTQNDRGQLFLHLIEKEKRESYLKYLTETGLQVVEWLSGVATPAASWKRCPLCQNSRFTTVFEYNSPPAGEIQFSFSGNTSYHRVVKQCTCCRLFISEHAMDMQGMYSGDYVTSTYGENGIAHAFNRIINLPPERSDNKGRALRVNEIAGAYLTGQGITSRTLLDVGSGLGVFAYEMKQRGWDCTALDPDPRSAAHAKDTVGVRAACADFFEASDLGHFDLVTFNKVLEHVSDPVAMLARTKSYLAPGGLVYIELPDGERASVDGPGREEFFIDHLFVFSAASIALLAELAGFSLFQLERLKEPSTKYTLRAFLAPQEVSQCRS